jgi:hypothetical protein
MKQPCLLHSELSDRASHPFIAGLAQGKTYSPEVLGEAAGQLPEDANGEDGAAADDDVAEEQARGAARSGGAAARPPGARQRRREEQQQQRQETLARKKESRQKHLTFMAYDRAVLDQMPEFVRQQVPFITTAKGGIDVDTMQLAKMSFASGVSIKGTADRLKELQNQQYYKRMLIYYSFAAAVKERAQQRRGERVGAGGVSAWERADHGL